MPKPVPRLLLSTSSSPAAALSFSSSSASSCAASSASGLSGIVSRELIEGERDRKEVGVLGMLDAELNEDCGYDSFVYFCGLRTGELPAEANVKEAAVV